MKLTLQTLTGTKYFLDVAPQDKAREVKVKIFLDLGISSKVRLLWQSKALEETVTLAGQGITEDATLQMVIEPDSKIILNIETLKKGTVPVEMNDSSTVIDLEQEILNLDLFLTVHASDFYFGDVQLFDEKLPFHLYGIEDGSIVNQQYEGSMQLQIDDARDFTFLQYVTVHGTDTIKNLKEKILQFLNDCQKEGEQKMITDNDIVLFHARANTSVFDELDRDSWTVNQCKIEPIDRIRIIHYHGRDVADIADIKTEEGTVTTTNRLYGLYNLETVHSLRLKIQHQFHIPFQKQELSIGGMNNPPDHLKKVNKDKFDKIVVKVLQ